MDHLPRRLTKQVPNDCGYNHRFSYTWQTKENGLAADDIPIILENVKHRWGWHFVKQEKQSQAVASGPHWYKSSFLVLSFESQLDLTIVKLMIGGKY